MNSVHSASSGTQVRRILMTADTIGGVWLYSLELIRALEKRGLEVVLATMGAPLAADQRRALRCVSNVTLYESRYKLEWMDKPWDDVQAAGNWLLEVEARTRPDIIHLNNYAHGPLDWKAPVLMVGHSCVYSWYAAVHGTLPPPPWDRYRQAVRRGLCAADKVTAPTRAMLERLKYHYGAFRTDGPIYNGRCAADFPPRSKGPFVFTAGRIWDEAKNIATLEKISARIPWPVFMAGECRHPSGGRNTFSGLQHLGRLGSEAMRVWLGYASIFALPARYEPFGLAALEAGLAGAALVLGDIPSLREVWGPAAVFVAPDDAEALCDTLQRLIRFPVWRRHLAGLARDRARRYTAERFGDAYLVLYTRLAEQHTSPLQFTA
jgi:glycogen synthase